MARPEKMRHAWIMNGDLWSAVAGAAMLAVIVLLGVFQVVA